MTWKLTKHNRFSGSKGPLVLVVLDGVGVGNGDESDAVKIATTPTMDRLWTPGSRCVLRAHGTAVGLPSDSDMGNSEVGHNAMGCGRVYDQGALLCDRAIESGRIFEGDGWRNAITRCAGNNGALHFVGLLSDGNVHSHIDQLIAMLRRAAADGVKRIFVHGLLDGRDVPPTSALIYIEQLETVLAELTNGDRLAAFASGGGRMTTTMDRYGTDWTIVERGYNAHVHGKARQFASAAQAVQTFRDEDNEGGDQFLPAFVIAREGAPIGTINNGDAVINFNFRGDRAIEISRAFDDDEFDHFDRGDRPDVLYAGMMEYDGDLNIPASYLVTPPDIERTMGEFLVHNEVPQLAISETHKFGHVTYFWNGNRSGKFDDGLETYVEIASDNVPLEQRPWMRAAEITDRLIAELRLGKSRFVRVNYANGDMVGHTGAFDATVLAVECLDLQLARLLSVVSELEGTLVVTADHGNADEMYQHGKDGLVVRHSKTGVPTIKTSHTLNPVPFMVYDAAAGDNPRYEVDPERAAEAGIANVTATCFELLGLTPPDDLAPSLLRFK